MSEFSVSVGLEWAKCFFPQTILRVETGEMKAILILQQASFSTVVQNIWKENNTTPERLFQADKSILDYKDFISQ